MAPPSPPKKKFKLGPTQLLHAHVQSYFKTNLIAKTVAVYKYAYRSVVLFCNTTGS